MFPDSFLEHLYQQNQNAILFADTVHDGARIAEQWLLGFSHAENPDEAATKSLEPISSKDAEKHLIFALALALSSPSRTTGQIFEDYENYLKDNRLLIASWIYDIAIDVWQGHHIDVLNAFIFLPDKRFYGIAYCLYKTNAEILRVAAVGRDNLKVLMHSLTDEDVTSDPIFEALAYFPVRAGSRVHKAIIKSERDEKRLIEFRLEAIYKQLASVFTHGVSYLYVSRKTDPALSVGSRIHLKCPEKDQNPPFYTTPEFNAALKADPKPMIKAFFIHRDAQLSVNPLNWGYVDQITQAFLDAGVTAEQIIKHGTRGKMATSTTLKSALTKFGLITEENQRFYQVAYKTYIEEHDAHEVIANCVDEKTLLAVYKATGNHAFLQAGNHLVRESAMASDLGL